MQADLEPVWILHVDGTSNSQGSGGELILANSKGIIAECALCFSFKAINNQAKYEALIAVFKLAKELHEKNLRVFADSQLVANQVMREYKARNTTMAK